MMNWYYRYRIRKSIDRQQQLSGWIGNAVARDEALSTFQSEYAAMSKRLSSDATAWMDAQTARIVVPSTNFSGLKVTESASRKRMNVAGGSGIGGALTAARWPLGMAAATLLVLGLLSLGNRSPRSTQGHNSARDTEAVIAASKAVYFESQAVFARTQAAVHRRVEDGSRKLLEQVTDSAMEPFREGGRIFGVALGELHGSACREKDRLAEFAKRLKNQFVH